MQNQILNLLKELKTSRSLTYLFISHDLSVVRYLSDRVCVMFLGKVCEIGPTGEVYRHPRHPYTHFLLDAVPLPDPSQRGKEVRLTRTEYAIIKLLMENPGRVIARSVLLDRIGADTPDCTERSLKQHISNLRKKLQDAGSTDYIETVWGIGFKLRAIKS